MLPKENRLTKTKNFKRVWQKGKGLFKKELGVKWVKNDLDVSRFAIIVSLKISKKATQRNKVKRRLREIVWKNLNRIREGCDVIIITRPGILELDYWQIEEILMGIFKKLELI